MPGRWVRSRRSRCTPLALRFGASPSCCKWCLTQLWGAPTAGVPMAIMEMPHAPAPVPGAEIRQHPDLLIHGGCIVRGSPQPPVPQCVHVPVFMTVHPTSEGANAHAQLISRLILGDLPTQLTSVSPIEMAHPPTLKNSAATHGKPPPSESSNGRKLMKGRANPYRTTSVLATALAVKFPGRAPIVAGAGNGHQREVLFHPVPSPVQPARQQRSNGCVSAV